MTRRIAKLLSAASLALSVASASAQPPLRERPEPVTSHWEGIAWQTDNAGSPMSLDGLTQAWGDEFDTLDVGCFDYTRKVGQHNWYAIAHDSGQDLAHGVCPSAAPSPYSISNGVLGITLSHPRGEWQTGALLGVDPMSEGRSFCYPLIVGRIKLPSAVPPHTDVWPSLWAEARYFRPGTDYEYPEIDILESWSDAGPAGSNQITLHEWPAKTRGSGLLPEHRYKTLKVAGGAPRDDQFHTYAIDTTSRRWWIYYFDGREVARLPMRGMEMRRPLSLRLSLSLGHKSAPDPAASYTMYVDYVRVYQARNTAPAALGALVSGDRDGRAADWFSRHRDHPERAFGRRDRNRGSRQGSTDCDG